MSGAGLRPGDHIVTSSGGLVFIEGNVEPSSAPPGEIAVEIEVGTVYYDADEEVTVLR